jgi:hypothetical protein
MLKHADGSSLPARADRATPGPWYWNSYDRIETPCEKGHPLDVTDADEPGLAVVARLHHTGNGDEMPDAEARRNALFIAASRQDIPALCAYIRHLESAVAALMTGDGG